MFPAAFEYRAPASLAEAVDILHDRGDDAKVMAGGQSLIPLLKLRFAQPALVVDIGRLPNLSGIGRQDGHLTLGALTRHVDVATAMHTAVNAGRTSYFCSAGCRAEFEREPAKCGGPVSV
jgi:CO/xanthine dehydrogenase FAD-binding subunit